MLRLMEAALVNNIKQVSCDESALQECFRCKDVSDLRFFHPEALNRLFDTTETTICINRVWFFVSMTERVESLICSAHSQILISLTQTPL